VVGRRIDTKAVSGPYGGDRYLAQAMPGDVLATAGHSEQSLTPLYEDADGWRRTLMEQLRRGD
jgi:hypothetical protein